MTKNFLIPVVSIVLLVLSTKGAIAEPCTGKIHDPATGQVLFLFDRQETGSAATLKVENTYRTPGGEVAVRESVELVDGQVRSFIQDRVQTGEKGTLLAGTPGEKMKFTWTKVKEGKTETDTDTVPKNLLIGPSIIPFLQHHWDELLKGETIDARLAVLDRKETVGFKYFLDSENPERVTFKMKPSSIVIAAVVKPLFFSFDRKTRRCLDMSGRIVPKVFRDGKWEDADGKLVFEYGSVNAPAPAQTGAQGAGQGASKK